jgi:hypothetical protein
MNRILRSALKEVKVGGVYEHYRWPDKNYRVIGVALDEATQQPLVVYRAEGELVSWIRPVDDFCAMVRTVNGGLVDFRQRFARVGYGGPNGGTFPINPVQTLE